MPCINRLGWLVKRMIFMLTSKELQHWYCSRWCSRWPQEGVRSLYKNTGLRRRCSNDTQKLEVILEPRPSYRKSHSMYRTSQSINWYAKVPIDKSMDFRLSIGNRTFDEFLHLLTIDRRLMTRTRFEIINKKKVILTIKSIN